MPKLADGGRRRKRMEEMTNLQAGKMIKKSLIDFVVRTNNLDKRIKALIDAAPGTSGQVVATLPSGLQAEITTLITLVDGIRQAHKATGD